MAYSYKLIKHIATLSETQYGSKQVNIISHNNANPKMDIRNWEKNGKMTVRGVTLDAQEWEALGECFSNSLKESNYAEIIDDISWLTKKGANKYEINLVDFDIDVECETELIIEEQRMISYSIVFQADKSKVQKHIEFLNDVNKYFSKKGIFANAFIDFNDEIEVIKIVGNIPTKGESTEKQIDAFGKFLSNYAESINEIGGLGTTQIRFEDIIVIGDRHACVHENHNKEELIVMVDFMNKEGNIFRVEAKASYCRECNLYFMRRHDYQMMKNRGRYSLMLCQEITEEKYLKNPSALQIELNDQSILHKYGYNVSDDMSSTQRQGILANMVDRKILSKDRIASYLAYFIRLNKNKEKDFSKAIDKWNQDREFVLGYNTDIRKKIEPKKITVIKYKI